MKYTLRSSEPQPPKYSSPYSSQKQQSTNSLPSEPDCQSDAAQWELELQQLRRENRYLKRKICEVQTGEKQTVKTVRKDLQNHSLRSMLMVFERSIVETLECLAEDGDLGRELQRVALREDKYLGLLQLFEQYYGRKAHIAAQFKGRAGEMLRKMTEIEARMQGMEW